MRKERQNRKFGKLLNGFRIGLKNPLQPQLYNGGGKVMVPGDVTELVVRTA